MKRIIVAIIIFTSLLSCFCATAQKKLSKKELVAAAVANKMMQKDLRILIANVISDMGITPYSEGLPVSLVNDKFTCHLPYMGGSQVDSYGSQGLTVTAEDVPVVIVSEFNEKKKYYKLNFDFKSQSEDETFSVEIKVFTNGKTTIRLDSTKRSTINYSGGLII